MMYFGASFLSNNLVSATTSILSFPSRNPRFNFSGRHIYLKQQERRSMTPVASTHIPMMTSVPFLEKSLFRHDIMCKSAKASLLAKQGLLTISEKQYVFEALKDEKADDESSVTSLFRSASNRKLEAPTDPIFWLDEAIGAIIPQIKRLQVALLTLAVKNDGVIVFIIDPYLKREQPVLLGHLLLAYVEQLDRDVKRHENCRKRLNLDVTSDAAAMSSELSNKCTYLELLSDLSIMANHLSQIGGQWAAWASDIFGFITSSDSVLTEQLVEILEDILTVRTSFTAAFRTYGKEQKEIVVRSVKKVIETLEVLSNFARNIQYNKDKLLKKDVAAGYDAATVGEYLVLKGIPIGTANEIVERAIALCKLKGCQLQDLKLEEFRSFSGVFDTDVYEYTGIHNCITKLTSYGSSGPQCVADQLDSWIKNLVYDKKCDVDEPGPDTRYWDRQAEHQLILDKYSQVSSFYKYLDDV